MTNAAVNEQEASGREQESWRGKGGSERQGDACCSNWLHTADSTLHNANVPAIIQLSSISLAYNGQRECVMLCMQPVQHNNNNNNYNNNNITLCLHSHTLHDKANKKILM